MVIGGNSGGAPGGGTPRSVEGVQIYFACFVPNAGAMTVHTDGPRRLKHGRRIVTLPPNDVPLIAADADSGVTNIPTISMLKKNPGICFMQF